MEQEALAASGAAQLASVGDQFLGNFSDTLVYLQENGGNLLWKLLMIALVLLAARLSLALITRMTSHIMDSGRYHQTEAQGKRIDTLMTLTRSFARYAVYFIAFLIVLGQLGMGNVVGNLIVTAGIGSVAIGFGAQSLVKDVVTGFFMMFENQFSVGDYVQIDDNVGTVTATAMRVTYLRTFKGEQVIIPNGSISRITNYSRGDSLAYFKVGVPYGQNTQQVMELLQQAANDYAEAHRELLLDEPYVQGIVEFADSAVLLGVGCKVHSMKQWEVERGLRLAVKEALDNAGIGIPYPHVVVGPMEGVALPKEESENQQERSM